MLALNNALLESCCHSKVHKAPAMASPCQQDTYLLMLSTCQLQGPPKSADLLTTMTWLKLAMCKLSTTLTKVSAANSLPVQRFVLQSACGSTCTVLYSTDRCTQYAAQPTCELPFYMVRTNTPIPFFVCQQDDFELAVRVSTIIRPSTDLNMLDTCHNSNRSDRWSPTVRDNPAKTVRYIIKNKSTMLWR